MPEKGSGVIPGTAMKLSGIGKILILLAVMGNMNSAGGQPPCASNPVANDYCSMATPICNLNGYCGNTSGSYTPWVSPTDLTDETNTPLGAVFCANIQNNSWLKFVADSTSAIFDVWVDNCQDNMGIQMQIYETGDCYNFVAVSNCWNPLQPINGQIIATGLIPGNVYYFMIDGTGGDICDYVIACNSGVAVAATLTPGQVICRGNQTTLQVIGGLTYQWSSNPPDPSLIGQNTHMAVIVSPAVTTIYTVTVTSEGLNIFCSDTVEVLKDTVTVINLSASVISLLDASCGQQNGSAVVQATGGLGSCTFVWNTNPPQYNDTAVNLAPGTWSVTVSNNGCDTVCSVVIGDIQPPQVTTGDMVEATCGAWNGQATANASGGSPPYSYLWNSSPMQTGPVLQYVPAGSYTVTVTDARDCISTATVEITGTGAVNVVVTGITDTYCGSHWGAASVEPVSGQEPFQYAWSTTPVQTSDTAFDLQPGTYTVTITDSNQCTGTATVVVSTINAPLVILGSTGEHCSQADGAAVADATGGSGYYTYLWSDGQTTSIATGLQSGSYFVTVDDGWCPVTDSVAVSSVPGPSASFTEHPRQVKLLESGPVNFTDESTGNIVSRLWTLGDGFTITLAHFSHAFTEKGTYAVTLVVTDNFNCSDTLTDSVVVRDFFTIYIPDSFTPNGDGTNDYFCCYGQNVDPAHFEMDIFNRWGNMVFRTTEWNGNQSGCWDGSVMNSSPGNPLHPEAYAYRVIFREIDGLKRLYTGCVILLR